MISAWWLLGLAPLSLVGAFVLALAAWWWWAFTTESMRDGR
jgi:hypothetical protein